MRSALLIWYPDYRAGTLPKQSFFDILLYRLVVHWSNASELHLPVESMDL